MNRTFKVVLGVLGAILVALLAGWIWGASGRSDFAARADDLQLRLALAHGRAGLLQARVQLFEVNFGNASRSLEAARTALQGAQALLDARDRPPVSAAIKQILPLLDEAQRQAGRLDQGAQARLAAALDALDRLPEAAPPR